MIATTREVIDDELLRAAPALAIIANYAVGYNNIDGKAAKPRGVVVTNTPDVLTDATADLTWALLLATARQVPAGHQLVQAGKWTGWEPTQLLGLDVHAKTLGIVGLGRIGRAVARRATGFDMRVIYWNRSRPSSLQDKWEWLPLDELLAQADFLTLHVRLTEDTRHLIGRNQLRRMRPRAVLINASRGPEIDEAALVEAPEAGWITVAGLDVY